MVRERTGASHLTSAVVILILAVAIVSVVYVDSYQSNSETVSGLEAQLKNLEVELNRGTISNSSVVLPVMNQAPAIRTIWETWYLSPSAHQDRFEPSFIVVNQGDTVRLTLIDNDTVAHDFVIGPPYNIVVNATVPGLINDFTGQKFTTPARNNSPGVVVRGTPGNVSATYSFVARYAGIYEFVCTYHAQVGMIGYLVVLPNSAYRSSATSTTQTSSGISHGNVSVRILPGAALNVSSRGYSPDRITVVIGVNNTVVWTNNDSSHHTVTANDGSFDSGDLARGQSFSYTFTSPGVYEYHCTYHPWMTGTVIVKASG